MRSMRKPDLVGGRKVAISKTTTMNCNHAWPPLQAEQQRNPANRTEFEVECSAFTGRSFVFSALAKIVCNLFLAEESRDVKSTTAAALAIVAVAHIDPFRVSLDGYSELTA